MPSEAVTFSSWCSIWYGAESDFSTFSATCAAPGAGAGQDFHGHVAAQFTMLSKMAAGWRVQHHAVPYDVAATVRRFRESGYMEAGGPMARLFLREIATVTHHFLPFVKRYGQAIQSGALPVETAVERFLGDF